MRDATQLAQTQESSERWAVQITFDHEDLGFGTLRKRRRKIDGYQGLTFMGHTAGDLQRP
jgi:hypothetical protein